ncbi:MAG: prolyl oligopeptidase family serine peptidase [Clostridia bacterium]|nr:prolyl oligopeptidase family serine peptidase [Clostridia bacterium]
MNFKDCMYNENEFGMNYKVFYPDDYKDLPLIVYLHGAGERGKNISHLYRHAIPKLIQEGNSFNAVILCPQCPEHYVWDNVVENVKGIIDRVAAEYEIKKDRICITGSSMGGFGTWMMAKTYPSFFAGIAPVAGGGMSWRTRKLISTPVLAIHGDEDGVVPLIYSQLMVDGVNANGGCAELIKLNGCGHNDGVDCAYRNTKVMDWLLQQRRTNFEYIPEVCEEMF